LYLQLQPADTQDAANEEFLSRDGILGHHFNKRLGSFAPCYSQSLQLADFKENHSLFLFKNPFKKIRGTRKRESIH
jgi:hypothetical protein